LFWLALIAFFLLFLGAISDILLPFILGILGAYFLDPAADRLEKCKLSRTVATSIITVSFFLIIVMLGLLIFPTLISETIALAKALPGYIADLERDYLPSISAWVGGLPEAHIAKVKEATGEFSGTLLTGASKLVGGVFASGMVVI